MDDDKIRQILDQTKIIAMVGASPKPDRPSHGVMRFLQSKNYRVIPVNPLEAGNMILGEKTYPSLRDIPADDGPIDMVDIFRRSEDVPPIVDEAIAIGAKTIWMQLGIIHPDAAHKAELAGLSVVMDRCPAIEYPRLIGVRP